MLDTDRRIETPEGVELRLRLAGPIIRIRAWLVDLLIRLALYIALSIALAFLDDVGMGLLLISVFLIEWFYPVIFEVFNHGRTPGKQSVKIRVVFDSGLPVTWSASLLRNLLRAVDFLPLFYGFGVLFMSFNRDFKRLGDLAAGTVVIYDEPPPKTSNIPLCAPQFLATTLNIEAQEAILNFAERAAQLSTQRQIELAEVLYPLTGRHGQDAVNYLYQLANGLLGRHQ